jgi:aryl-alcohol dehydrogenase-like predicted oxidoreductase
MHYTTLGNTGLTVSKICFGTMSFGGDADEPVSEKLFNKCREAGVNFFDTANAYSRGRSEEILGKLAKPIRDDLILTTKVRAKVAEGHNNEGLSRRHIMQQIEASLRRLQTDRVEVYFCHHWDAKTPIDETLRAMDDLVKQGKVLYPAVSNWTAWQTALGLGRAAALNTSPIYVLQPMYSLAKRTAEVEILPLAAHQNLGVIPYSPLGGGLLTGKYNKPQPEKGRLLTNKNYTIRYGDFTHNPIAQKLADYGAKIGVSPVTLAVAWVKSHPAITAPIIGARNLEQLEPSLAAGSYEMSPEQRAELSALTPPPPVPTDRDEER